MTTNLIVIIMNLMDTVYFQYTHRRTTASVFSEFKNEGNLGGIIGTELLNHWYLTLFAIAFGYALFKLYRKPKPVKVERMPVYYTVHLLYFGAWSVLVYRRNAWRIYRHGASNHNQQRQ